MQRRDFLKQLLNTGLAGRFILGTGLLGLGGLSSPLQAAPVNNRQLVQITLDGGPDFRHLLVPEPNFNNQNTFGYTFWANHWRAHALNSFTENNVAERWNNDYLPVTLNGQTFGVLKKAAWLKNEIESGRVALINNIYVSSSRDHVHSQMALDYGRMSTKPNEMLGSGWGGRLAAAHQNGRVVSLTGTPRRFCYGPLQGQPERRGRTDNLISLSNARTNGLFNHRLRNLPENHWQATQSRANLSYYQSLQSNRHQLPEHLQLLLDHERELRDFAEITQSIFTSHPMPEALENLGSHDFFRQIRSLHDLLNHLGSHLNMRIASLGLGGWDSHKNQKSSIEPLLERLFGDGQGLHQLFTHLNSTAKANTVMVLSGEFGRQIRANGDRGTDHGEGNLMLVIGSPVKGGLYGELFPEREIEILNARTTNTPDIEGRTNAEHLFKALADWSLGYNSGQSVILNPLTSQSIETGVSFNQLLG